jgi:hydroxymethylpyrimidine pyrophosphatase-like HAD family hydrolase
VDDQWQVAFLTGRIFSFANLILKNFNFPYIVAVQNGADILQMPEKKILYRSYLSSEIVPQIEEVYKGEKEDFIIYAGIEQGDFCYYRPDRFSKKVLEYLKVLESLSAKWEISDFKFAKGTAFPLIKTFGEKAVMKKLFELLSQNRSLEVSMIRDPIDPNLYLNLITDHTVSKGSTLRWIKEYLKSPIVIGAGDDLNDVKMLKEADLAIAIETAPKEILELADIIAKPADQLGIIRAVEEAITLAHY